MAKGQVNPLVEALFGGHYFPHRLSFLLDNPLRNLLISPQTLVERLSLRPDARVLELGAGPGFFSVALARQIPLGHLGVVDRQPELLAKARRRLERARLSNVGLTQAEAGSLPFPEASVDVALLVAVLGEVPDERKCLRSVWRVPRAGGVVAFHEHLPDPDLIRPDHLRRLAVAAGFIHRNRSRVEGGRVAGKYCYLPAPSELDVRVASHPAQAFTNAPRGTRPLRSVLLARGSADDSWPGTTPWWPPCPNRRGCANSDDGSASPPRRAAAVDHRPDLVPLVPSGDIRSDCDRPASGSVANPTVPPGPVPTSDRRD